MMGLPYDMPPSPSVGFVGGSTMLRFTPLLMTRLNINPGESGAPFLNARGEVVGLLFGGSTQQPNVAYALPSKAIRRVAADFRQFGEARYGWLGMDVRQVAIVTATNVPPQPAVRVELITDGTPAKAAGLRAGDLLLGINQQPVRTLPQVAEALFYLRAGEQASIQVLRSNQTAQVAFNVGQRPAQPGGNASRNDNSAAPAAVPAEMATPIIHVQPASATGFLDKP
jgi:serine protease Do